MDELIEDTMKCHLMGRHLESLGIPGQYLIPVNMDGRSTETAWRRIMASQNGGRWAAEHTMVPLPRERWTN